MGRSPEDPVAEGIAYWRAQRPDLDTSGTEVVARVLRLATIFRDGVGRALAARALGIGEYSVLAILRSRGGASGELPPKVLADATHVTSGGIANLVKRLERAGLVDRRPDPADGRGTLVRLTPGGRELVDAAVVDVAEAERKLVAALSEPERCALAAALSSALRAVEPPTTFRLPESR